MGLLVTTQSAQAAREVEAATDATHVNAMADIHAAFENGEDAAARVQAAVPKAAPARLLVNPVDLLRAINLPKDLAPTVPPLAAVLSICLWLSTCLALSAWKLHRLDL
jgi:hypothetical protein